MRNSLVLSLVVLTLITAGCETAGENTKKGAGLGALAGAAAGGIIGHQDGHGWEGALIGAAAGGTMGGLIGNQIDKKEIAGNANYISLPGIVEMAKNNTPDNIIIGEIDRTKSKYKLNIETINWLKNSGVSDRVIDHMMSTTN